MLATCVRSTVPIFAVSASSAARTGLAGYAHAISGSGASSARLLPTILARVRCYARPTFQTPLAARVKPARKTLKETLMSPATDTPFVAGRLGLAIGSGVGIGALCYYGLGMSNSLGTIDKMALWPQYVKDRVQATYGYLAGSLGLTAASALAVSRSPVLMNLVMRNGWMSLLLTLGAMIGTGAICRSIPYDSLTIKHLAWALHTGVMGAVVAPLTLMGGPILIRAAWYTAGVVGGMSAVAFCAPSEKFMNMGGILGAGLGVVLVSSIGTWFLPPTTALGAGLYSIALYGGLVLFSAFLLYDTQRVIRLAEAYPPPMQTNQNYSLMGAPGYQQQQQMQMAVPNRFDPVNACLSIYLDALNIFIRIAMILGGGGGVRRK